MNNNVGCRFLGGGGTSEGTEAFLIEHTNMGAAMCTCHLDQPSMEPVAPRDRSSSHDTTTVSRTGTQLSLLSPLPSLRSARSPPASARGKRRKLQPCSPHLRHEQTTVRCANPLGIAPRGPLPVSDSSGDTIISAMASHERDGLVFSQTIDSKDEGQWSSFMDSTSLEHPEGGHVTVSFEPMQLPESFLEQLRNRTTIVDA